MDNSKTGLFIREMRKEKNMTQKYLALQLNITDRAVSKWEREHLDKDTTPFPR